MELSVYDKKMNILSSFNTCDQMNAKMKRDIEFLEKYESNIIEIENDSYIKSSCLLIDLLND